MDLPSALYGPAGAIAALAFVLVLIVHGDLVPGFIYRRSEARGDKFEAAFIDVLTKAKTHDGGGG